MQIPGLYVGPSSIDGKGVYCRHEIVEGSVIEICPTLSFDPQASSNLNLTPLHDYLFEWGENANSTILLLGYGSLYNHSYQPNARYDADPIYETFTIRALCDIPEGHEITFNYNGEPSDHRLLWFTTS